MVLKLSLSFNLNFKLSFKNWVFWVFQFFFWNIMNIWINICVIDRRYWYIDQIIPKNVKKCHTRHWKMSHLLIYKFTTICKLADGTYFSGEWDIFSFLFSILWFNLVNIKIFSVYYTYICSNINNLSEKEPKTPEKQYFLIKLISKPWLRLRITAWESSANTHIMCKSAWLCFTDQSTNADMIIHLVLDHFGQDLVCKKNLL